MVNKDVLTKTKKNAVDIKIKVVDILGSCPVYQKSDSFYLENGYILDPKKSGRICMHSLSSIMPYHVALSHGVRPVEVGLNEKDENKAYVQCLDPCRYTGGGTVVFELEVIR